jgi:hypothetical protein
MRKTARHYTVAAKNGALSVQENVRPEEGEQLLGYKEISRIAAVKLKRSRAIMPARPTVSPQ